MVKIEMDMPESCVLCRFSHYDGEYVRCPYAYDKAIEDWDEADSKRAEWCPLEEVYSSG